MTQTYIKLVKMQFFLFRSTKNVLNFPTDDYRANKLLSENWIKNL